jgi:hypothetical protein
MVDEVLVVEERGGVCGDASIRVPAGLNFRA